MWAVSSTPAIGRHRIGQAKRVHRRAAYLADGKTLKVMAGFLLGRHGDQVKREVGHSMW